MRVVYVLENMRSELLRVQQEEMQRLHREFEVQLAGMRLQLQRANELHSREVSVNLIGSCQDYECNVSTS